MSGAGPSSGGFVGFGSASAGQTRASTHPSSSGGENDDRERDREEREREEGGDGQARRGPDAVSARRLTRTTAWITMAMTAEDRPRKSASSEVGVAVADVDGRQAQQCEHARQHEQSAGDEAASKAVEQPADVDGELLGLRPGEQHAVVEGVQEPPLTDPPLLVDQGALHDGDLAGRSAEGLQRDRRTRPWWPPQRDHVADVDRAGLGATDRQTGRLSPRSSGAFTPGPCRASRLRLVVLVEAVEHRPGQRSTSVSSRTIDSPRSTTSRPGASGAS